MDDRQQTKVTEGAGLEESRLNQEFIDWLNVWGFRILMVVLIVAAAWVGKTRWDQYQERRLDTALVELEAEAATGSPDGLVALANQHRGIRSVWEQAMLQAAAVNLESGRRALVPGGDPENDEDFLTGEEADGRLQLAAEQYEEVLERIGRESNSINALVARSGLVSCLISLREGDRAREELTRLIALLDESGFDNLKVDAEEQLASLDELLQTPMLPTYAELSVIAQQRAPIAIYGESMDDVAAIRSRQKSEDLIEPAEDIPAPTAPGENEILDFEIPLAPMTTPEDDAGGEDESGDDGQ